MLFLLLLSIIIIIINPLALLSGASASHEARMLRQLAPPERVL